MLRVSCNTTDHAEFSSGEFPKRVGGCLESLVVHCPLWEYNHCFTLLLHLCCMLCGHHRTEAFALERDCPTFVRSRLSRNVLFQLAHLNGHYCLRHSNALSPCCADFHRHSHLLSLLVELLVNEKVSSEGPWALYEVWVCRTKKSAYLPRCKSLTRRFFFYQTDFVSYKSEGNGEVHSPGQETNWK